MKNIIDDALSWPNKIDIYIYSAGAGGEFFTQLCSLAHLPTRNMLKSKTLEGASWRGGIITFKSAEYFNFENIYIGEIGKHLTFYSKLINDPVDRINYYKMVLAHAFLNTTPDPVSENIYVISKKRQLFKNVNIILCTHWTNANLRNKKLDNRTFGLPLFEKQKYWNVIHLDPQTSLGQDFVTKFAFKSKMFDDLEIEKIKVAFNHSAFKNIKLKFPFMDYMISNDFNSIKDYLEVRYGPDLDYDFIDKALITYKKVRIDPYL